MEKIDVSEITLVRWGKQNKRVHSFPEANDALRHWAYELDTGDTEYIDVYVEWQDGQGYTTRFDLLPDNRTGVDLGLHVQNNIAFKAGEWRPANVTPEAYERIVDTFREEGLVAGHKRLLEGYRLE